MMDKVVAFSCQLVFIMTSLLLFAEDDVEVADEDEIDDDEDDDEDYSEAEPLDFDTYYSFNDEDLDLDGGGGGGGGHAGTSSGRTGGDNIYNNNDDPEFFVYDCLEVEKAQKTLQDQVTVVCNVTKVRVCLLYICSSFPKFFTLKIF